MGAGDIDADPAGTTTADRATSEIMIQANPATVSTAGDASIRTGPSRPTPIPTATSVRGGVPRSRARPTRRSATTITTIRFPAQLGIWPILASCPHRPDIEYARTSGGFIIPTVYADRPAPASGWWAYVLDSQCTHAEDRGPSCPRYSNQLNWFRAPMATHPVRYRVVFWHHPQFGWQRRTVPGTTARCTGTIP
jgi:hypothetical protein